MTRLKDLIEPESLQLKHLGCSDFKYPGHCCHFCHDELAATLPIHRMGKYKVQVCCAIQDWIEYKLEHEK